MSDNPTHPVDLAFAAGKIRPGEIRLLGVQGREQISRLFQFDLHLLREEGPFSDDELETLFTVPCAVALGPEPGSVVRGVLDRIRRLNDGRTGSASYSARLVPTMSLLTLGRTNRIFQNLTIPEVIASVLATYKLLPERDYLILPRRKLPRREYIVQYEESDWDFLQRWLEHEGLYYWFEHGEARELLMISDTREDATPIAGSEKIAFHASEGLHTGGKTTVTELSMEQRRVPARVALFDYNYRTPQQRLITTATADAKTGFGTRMEYGEHFKNADEGAAIATLRAELLACGRRTYAGKTDSTSFRAGHRFTLEDHDDEAYNQTYLVTSVDHSIGAMSGGSPSPYEATFEAIPFKTQFRPDRTTPWPSIHGVMHGHVSGDSSGQHAEIDEYGRYKVSLPFDSGNVKGLAASRWIRMAQPSSGPGYGSHHPLHKGTEVLVAYVDGDPDRPIILASVPNTHTVSPSTHANATQSVTRTASGIHLEMEDLATGGYTARGRKR